jgi:hypothetical protein
MIEMDLLKMTQARDKSLVSFWALNKLA